MFWEHIGHQAVRKGDWKAEKEPKGNWELYNLKTDNTELHDLSTKQPAILKDLVTKWNQWAKENFVLPKRKDNDSKNDILE